MSTLPYPRSKLRALLKTWASEPPAPSDPNNPDSPQLAAPSRPHSLGPTVDAVAHVAWTVFMRRLGQKVVRDHAVGTGGRAGVGVGAKPGKGKVLRAARKGRKVKVGRAEIRRAKREAMTVGRRRQQT